VRKLDGQQQRLTVTRAARMLPSPVTSSLNVTPQQQQQQQRFAAASASADAASAASAANASGGGGSAAVGGSSGGSAAVGVIRLSSFNARALRDVSSALQQLQHQGATELVLDLRDNRCARVCVCVCVV
jgi:C-terminal processing protease CtpA/Prc